MNRSFFSASVGVLALLCATPAFAQRGNQSDVTGPPNTGSSGTVGGVFTPQPGGSAGGGAGAGGGPRGSVVIATNSPAVFAAVSNAAQFAIVQLSSGQVAAPTSITSAEPGGAERMVVLRTATGGNVAVPAGVAEAVLNTMLRPSGASAQLSQALSGSAGAAAGPAVGSLMNSIVGLLTIPNPAQLLSAVVAYNQVVNTASAGFLANPPAEFVAIGAVLGQLTVAAQSASPLPPQQVSPNRGF